MSALGLEKSLRLPAPADGVCRVGMWPLLQLRPGDGGETDRLLVDWEHPLGACRRPFGSQEWVLEVEQRPVALAVSASTVSATVRADDGREWSRGEIVELARIARAPEWAGMLRVMLRLWRMVCAPAWAQVYWPLSNLVSYAMPGTPGDIYRFDGWERLGKRKPGGGGGTWTSSRPEVNKIADGVKTLWAFPMVSP